MSKRDGSKRRDRSTPFGLEEDRIPIVRVARESKSVPFRLEEEECSVEEDESVRDPKIVWG
jgi:hypothetical protein